MTTHAIHPICNITPDGRRGFCTKSDDFGETLDYLAALADEHFDKGFPSPANPEVTIIPVPPEHFRTTVRDGKVGEEIRQRLEPRNNVEEDPRIGIPYVTEGEHRQAGGAALISYPAHLLGDHRSSDKPREIVALVATPGPEGGNEPMHYLTMLYNYADMSGGTDADLPAEKKLENLLESFRYWHNKVQVDLSGGN